MLLLEHCDRSFVLASASKPLCERTSYPSTFSLEVETRGVTKGQTLCLPAKPGLGERPNAPPPPSQHSPTPLKGALAPSSAAQPLHTAKCPEMLHATDV